MGALGGARKGLNKNLENNPMQSRVDPARNFPSEETEPSLSLGLHRRFRPL
jgi:hypothetical protein